MKKLWRKLFGKSSAGEGAVEKPLSYRLIVDDRPETRKKQAEEVIEIMDKIEEAHRGEYVVMHTTITQALLSKCQDDVPTVQKAFGPGFNEDVVDLGMMDFRSFKHLSVNAIGDESVVALAIHGKSPLNADYDYSSNWQFKKQPMAMSSKEVKELSQKLSRLDEKQFCKEHAIPQSDAWILKRLSEKYRQAEQNDLAMVVSCRSDR